MVALLSRRQVTAVVLCIAPLLGSLDAWSQSCTLLSGLEKSGSRLRHSVTFSPHTHLPPGQREPLPPPHSLRKPASRCLHPQTEPALSSQGVSFPDPFPLLCLEPSSGLPFIQENLSPFRHCPSCAATVRGVMTSHRLHTTLWRQFSAGGSWEGPVRTGLGRFPGSHTGLPPRLVTGGN